MTKIDLPQSRIEAIFEKRECAAIVRRINRRYTIFYEDRAVTRIRQCGRLWEVLWWSPRDRWESIGDFGGMALILSRKRLSTSWTTRWAYPGSGP